MPFWSGVGWWGQRVVWSSLGRAAVHEEARVGAFGEDGRGPVGLVGVRRREPAHGVLLVLAGDDHDDRSGELPDGRDADRHAEPRRLVQAAQRREGAEVVAAGVLTERHDARHGVGGGAHGVEGDVAVRRARGEQEDVDPTRGGERAVVLAGLRGRVREPEAGLRDAMPRRRRGVEEAEDLAPPEADAAVREVGVDGAVAVAGLLHVLVHQGDDHVGEVEVALGDEGCEVRVRGDRAAAARAAEDERPPLGGRGGDPVGELDGGLVPDVVGRVEDFGRDAHGYSFVASGAVRVGEVGAGHSLRAPLSTPRMKWRWKNA